MLEAGAQVGRFVVVRRLGAGGMGAVFEARDPELSRSVAVKVLHDRGGDTLRLLREAQALARISHPNVVAVYELGSHDGQVFVAMELVDGVTLDHHLAGHARSWRDVLAVFVAAGRGLAAVHAHGLVHRDVKPSNILVDDHGRVRIGDFGLARHDDGSASGAPGPRAPAIDRASGDTTVDGHAPADATADTVGSGPTPDGLLASPLTATGAVIGTPRYMAPEQHAGLRVTRAADQFSFCVALWEALHGEHPFGDGREIVPAVIAGRRAAPPSGRRVPAWLERAIARGLASDPAARWPSMEALLDELELRPRRRRRRAIAAAMLAAVTAAAGAAWIAAPRRAIDPCGGADARTAGVWDAARRDRARAHLVVVDSADGAARATATARLFDHYAADWRAMHTDACRANRVTGSQSDALYDRRMRCLDRRLVELGDAAAATEVARDPAAVDHALVAAHQLTALSACADTDALLAALPPPDDPAARKRVEIIEAELDAIDRDRKAGKLDDLDPRTAVAVEHARAATHPPLLARALELRARFLVDISNITATVDVLRELTDVAAQAHDDATASWAWSKLIDVVGWQLGKYEEALALLPAARAAMLRAGSDPDQRVDFLYASAGVLYSNHRADEAHRALDEARGILERGGAGTADSPQTPRLADVYFEDATFHGMDGEPAKGEPLLRKAIALYTSAYGPDHPEVAWGWHQLGELLRFQGKADDALAAYRTAARIREARLGETPALATTLVAECAELQELGRYDQTLAPIGHAITILRSPKGTWDSELGDALMVRSTSYDALGRTDDARRDLDDSIALFEKLGEEQVDLPVAIFNRAELLAKQHHCDQALADYRRAIALTLTYRGPDHPGLIYFDTGLGKCLVELHEPADALAPLRRALALTPQGVDAAVVATARLYLGRALYDTGKHADGLASARAAHDALTALGTPAAKSALAETDAWLAAHR